MNDLVCGTCRACCYGTIVLHPSLGDDPSQYDCRFIEDIGYVLNRKEDGSCVYLAESGCSIWGRHPGVCKAFDCRVYARSNWAKVDPLRDHAVIDAGMSR